jgi:hypothetical protein
MSFNPEISSVEEYERVVSKLVDTEIELDMLKSQHTLETMKVDFLTKNIVKMKKSLIDKNEIINKKNTDIDEKDKEIKIQALEIDRLKKLLKS